MIPPRPTEMAHLILQRHIRDGDTVIDATAGNGHDTLFLARAVGETGHVHAIDIQPQAIARARLRIDESGLASRVSWHPACHSSLHTLVSPASISTVVFNLGYLPGDDHGTTTETQSTLSALQAAREVLLPGGVLSVTCYPGHDAGATEAEEIAAQWPAWSASGWRIACYSLPFTIHPSPVLWLACKPESPDR